MFLPVWMVPNLCLAIVVYLGVYEANITGACLAFIVGLLLDLASGTYIGPWSGAFSAVFGVLAQGGKRMFLESGPTIAIMVGLSSICGTIVYLFLLSQFHLTWGDIFSGVLFGTALLTAALSPVVFAVLRKFLVRKSQGRYI